MYRAPSLRLLGLSLLLFALFLNAAFERVVTSAYATINLSTVRISQIYGAGGNQTALWQADFVEIFNATDVPVDLTGWAVEYASADSDNWKRTPLDGRTISPYSYILISGATGNGGNGAPLPAPDVIGTTNLSAADGKIRLLDGTGAVLDLAGYGGANAFEGSAPVAALSATQGAQRNDNGCTDTDDNAADFQRVSPSPRNSASPAYSCAGGASPTATSTATPSDGSPPPVTDTPTATPTATPPTATGLLLISEFMADPAAVDDDAGEWIEIANPGTVAVNLRDWQLGDEGRDQHTIAADLWIDPGGYVVLARNSDLAQNGGVAVHYLYAGISLANGDDELQLYAPDRSLVDQVKWGAGTALSIPRAASLYRAALTQDAAWLAADAPWPGSAGDFGHPGSAAAGPQPTATSTLSAEPTTTATGTVTGTVTATVTVTPSDPIPTLTPDATPTPVHRIFISEVLADSSAVNDSEGEWIEIHNAGTEGIDLQGWTLADDGRDQHVIAASLWIDSGAYIVLARNGDVAQNGGVNVAYVYRGMNLSNDDDEIRLFDPGGVEQDRLIWGGNSPLRSVAGASLERTTFDSVAQWQIALATWPGSAGDRGSPGAAYSLPPLETPTPTSTPIPSTSPTPTFTPTVTPTPTPTATRPAVAWPLPQSSSTLQIDEVAFRGSDIEFVVLVNTSPTALDLTGWLVGDAEVPGDGEGIYALPSLVLLPDVPFVIARNGVAFQQEYGRLPDAQFEDDDAVSPVLSRVRSLATGSFALNDSGDEVVLLDPNGVLADAVAYGNGEALVLGLSTPLTPVSGASLQRVPGYTFPAIRDLRLRFLWARPDPFGVQRLPDANVAPPLPLPNGLIGVVGTMGVSSTFSPEGIAPPHRVGWAAAEASLHFVAIADTDPASMQVTTSAPIVSLPTWRWQGGEDDEAVIYGPYFAAGSDRVALLDGLAATGAPVQWIRGSAPAHPGVLVTAADKVDSAADVYAYWSAAALPPLLAGNSLPALPGYLDPTPRFTGLAVETVTVDAILAALRARRGWLTSDPNLSLTLRSESGVWMGGVLPVAAELSLILNYQDGNGEVAGLALWQDGKPLRQLDIPPANGEWRVTVPAVPNSLIYAVATQIDGDFAVSMPLRVGGNGSARIWINEVMPVPLADFNGDGVAGSGDEYIELWNAGPDALALAGWQLADRPAGDPGGRRIYTLGPQHFLPVGAYLVLWSKDTFIGLNNSNERLELLDPSGQLVDFIEWGNSPGGDRTLSRVPDGGRWDLWGSSPGRSNGDYSLIIPPTSTPPPWAVAGSAAPGTPGGEAVGPLGSVTQAKLAGLGEAVRFVGVITAPPGLFNAAIYVADPAAAPNHNTAAVGIQVYLNRGDFPALVEGDRVDVQGVMDSFHGEREIRVALPEDLWRVDSGAPLLPLPVNVVDIGEKLEGRLVTFEGIVTGFRGSSFFLADPTDLAAEPVEVHVRSSLPWRRPYVVDGERWRVTGIVGQFALEAPWNGGYRVLVRYEGDLVRLARGD